MAETHTITLKSGKRISLRRWYSGTYRLTLDDETFGQIKRHGREWHAEVRYTQTGAIKRYAGIWGSLREATAELVDIKNGLFGPWIFRHIGKSAHTPCA